MKSHFYKFFIFFALLFLSLMSLEQIYAQINIEENKLQQNKITSVAEKLEQQLAENKITIDEWVQYIVYSIFEPGKLSLEYKNLERNGLQTWILSKIFNNWSKLKISTKLELQNYGFSNNGGLEKKSSLDSTRETTHFKFWYSVTPGDSDAVSIADADSNGTPDYIDTMMTVFEHVWVTEIDSFGYPPPPPASKWGGAQNKYVVVIGKISSTAFGLTSPDSLYSDNPKSSAIEKKAYSSHIIMHNNYNNFPQHTQLEDIQVTAAHEFFHSIQYGYDGFAQSWLMESTASWMEDEVYDNINDNYGYLNEWFSNPIYPLDAKNSEKKNHKYGSWIFFRYISEHITNRNTVREIWEKMLSYNNDSTDYSFNAINDALVLHGTNFKDVFRNFLIANYVKTITPYNYEEGANYPKLYFNKTMIGNMWYQSGLYRHGADYYHFSPNLLPNGNDQINFTFTPIDTNANFGIEVVTQKGNIITKNVFNSSFTLNNTKDLDDIIAIVMDFSTFSQVDSQYLKYKLSVSYNTLMYKIVKGHKVNVRNLSNSNFEILTDIYKSNSQADVNYFTRFRSLKTWSLNTQSYNVNLFLTDNTTPIPVIEWISTDFYNTRYSYYYKNGSLIKIDLPYSPDDRHLLAANGNIAWIAGDTLWAYNMDLNSAEKIGYVGYTGNWSYYQKKIITAGSSAAWLTQSGDIYVKNGILSPQLIANNFSTDGNWNFNGNVLVWTAKDSSNNYRIKAYSVTTDEYFTIDSSGSRGRVVVTGGDWSNSDVKIAFSDNTQYPPKYYYTTDLPVASKKELIVPGDGYLLINSTGIGLEIIKTNQTPQFYFHSFKSNNDYTTYLSDYQTAEPFTSNGDYIRMLDSTFYFDAINLTSSDNTVFIYSLKMGDIVTSISSDNINIPKEFSISQNYPNPFNPSTTIEYKILAFVGNPKFSSPTKVTLKIYDVLGKEVKTLVNKEQKAGNYKVTFDASQFASGVYFYRIITGDFIQTKKMVLIK